MHTRYIRWVYIGWCWCKFATVNDFTRCHNSWLLNTQLARALTLKIFLFFYSLVFNQLQTQCNLAVGLLNDAAILLQSIDDWFQFRLSLFQTQTLARTQSNQCNSTKSKVHFLTHEAYIYYGRVYDECACIFNTQKNKNQGNEEEEAKKK